MYCSKCGKQINDDAVFCMGCGERVVNASREMNIGRENVGQSQSEANIAKMAKAKGSKPAIAWIIAAVASVIAIVAVIMCVLNMPKSVNSVPVPKTCVSVYTDSSTGQAFTETMNYECDGFLRLDNDIIQYNAHYTKSGKKELVSYYYSSTGKLLGYRTYTEGDNSDYSTDFTTTDFIDVGYATTVDDYVRHHMHVKEVKDNTVYYEDGAYTKLTVENGLIYGEDVYWADGTHFIHSVDFLLSGAGNKSIFWIDLDSSHEGFEYMSETTFETMQISFD